MLRAEGLVRLADERRLLDGLDLSLAPGETLALRGATGSGKSVCLRALARLDPLEAGTIWLDRTSVMEIPPSEYRAQVAYLHQRPVLFGGTVEQELRAFLDFRVHRERSLTREQLCQRMAEVGRGEAFLEQPADRLSGGEAQIVCLLRTMLIEPRVLLLDEPTAATDPEATGQIERLVAAWRGADRAVIWVTHDAAQAERVASRQLWLSEGRAA